MNNIKTFENFNNQDIFKYIRNNDIQSVKNYIDSGYDLNINEDEYDCTPLIYATKYKRIEIIKLLLNAGADIDKQNKYGSTALIFSVSSNYDEIIELLLYAGSDIDKQNDQVETALIWAAYNNKENIELLLNYHADEFILNNYGGSFYDYLNDENKKYFLKEYPNSVYNAIYHKYKKSFTEFVKDYNIKN